MLENWFPGKYEPHPPSNPKGWLGKGRYIEGGGIGICAGGGSCCAVGGG